MTVGPDQQAKQVRIPQLIWFLSGRPRTHESAEMIDAFLAAWHRLLAAMHVAWGGLSEAERSVVDAPPEDAD